MKGNISTIAFAFWIKLQPADRRVFHGEVENSQFFEMFSFQEQYIPGASLLRMTAARFYNKSIARALGFLIRQSMTRT